MWQWRLLKTVQLKGEAMKSLCRQASFWSNRIPCIGLWGDFKNHHNVDKVYINKDGLTRDKQEMALMSQGRGYATRQRLASRLVSTSSKDLVEAAGPRRGWETAGASAWLVGHWRALTSILLPALCGGSWWARDKSWTTPCFSKAFLDFR